MSDLRVLMTGLMIPESARWHDGRLWFSVWGDRQVLALDADGKAEVMGEGTTDFGYCIDWLADGRLLSTGTGLWRTEPDGTVVPHADLSGLPGLGWNEIVVDGRGYVYINNIGFDYINNVGFDFGGGETVPAGIHRRGHPGRRCPPGGRRDRISQRHGGDTGQPYAGRRRVVHQQAHRGYARAGRSSTGSTSTSSASRARWAATTAGRSNGWRPTGAASNTWATARAPAWSCPPSGRPPLTPAAAR
jgi:hypothetical protein